MASFDHVSDSDEDSDSVELVHTPNKKADGRELSIPGSGLSHRFRDPPKSPIEQSRVRSSTSEEKRIAVMVKGPSRPWEYQPFVEDDTVDTVLAEVDQPGGGLLYRIEYEDGRRDDVSFDDLITLRNGRDALAFYNGDDDGRSTNSMDSQSDSTEPPASSSKGKRARKPIQRPGFVNSTQISSDDDDGVSITKKRRLAKGRASFFNNGTRNSRFSNRPSTRATHDEDSDSSSDAPRKSQRSSNRTTGLQNRSTNASRASSKAMHKTRQNEEVDELGEGEEESDSILYDERKRKPQSTKGNLGRSDSKGKKRRSHRNVSDSDSSSERREPTRRSGRERGGVISMKQHDVEEEVYADEVAVVREAKITSVREIFSLIPKTSPFAIFHYDQCDVCHGDGNSSTKGLSPLVYCQGCSSSIHKVCLGYRSARESRVTKVGHENFVLQCKRCIGIASKKDPAAPRLDTCQECKEPGSSCAEFSSKKTPKQEEKLRVDNDGDDPITEVSSELINNPANVLFRCGTCRRAWHFYHLPPLDDELETPEDLEGLRNQRRNEYSEWQCKECLINPGKVEALVAWRPLDMDSYTSGQTVEAFREDQIEYLIKWVGRSYHKCAWVPGGWIWGVTMVTMRNAFFNRDEGANRMPKFTFKEAVPEDFLRMEIVFDVRYDSYRPKSERFDKMNIAHVAKVLVKFEGLAYDNTVWDDPPTPEDADRWSEFVAAYNEYLAGKYFNRESAAVLKKRVEDFRKLNFVELKHQPSALVGGEMMDYQKEGMNWLLYNFHQQKNVILADEMGLGKTIQVIAFIAALVKHKPKCWPFLIVTPNSTCPNWRREIKKWAPDIRVVAYYGGREARKMAMDYELFPEGLSAGYFDMRAHVVVTSYDAPVQDPVLFRKIKWAGMIVDEGQRLKNDENLLYGALTRLDPPFKTLLTGTPLQNNKRELFNLLHFCDPDLDAAELDEEYQDLNKDSLSKLHEMLRPFFLRRTKAQVLKFLPSMAQVIVPVTMSVVQKKLYISILEKKPELIQALFDPQKNKQILRKKDRGNLNNLLMQLRKCLCHPFVYSAAIEGTSTDNEEAKRTLIDASSKFQLLEIMLPKLRERGHRVLLFSQFLAQLDFVEDFLTFLDLPFERLDGTVSAMEKQRRIDAFNAPDSKLFAFLLSTRAGGVGINLATADTVIVMDPDFNPHQDIQAFSRAHRIGQKKKVLVFQLMTKDSVEEKITQIGRKKMALDQALIENMNTEDDAGEDVESILKHGAKALFDNDDTNDIHYESASVDKLLDRTSTENTLMGEEKTTESQFSFARVWVNDKATLTEDAGDPDAEEPAMDPGVWDKIMAHREAEALAAKEKEVADYGRGKKRTTRAVAPYNAGEDPIGETPKKRGRKRRADDDDDDVDFKGVGDSDGEDEDDNEGGELVDPQELEMQSEANRSKGIIQQQGPEYPPILPPQRNHSSHSGQARVHDVPLQRNNSNDPRLRFASSQGNDPEDRGQIFPKSIRYRDEFQPTSADYNGRGNSTGGFPMSHISLHGPQREFIQPSQSSQTPGPPTRKYPSQLVQRGRGYDEFGRIQTPKRGAVHGYASQRSSGDKFYTEGTVQHAARNRQNEVGDQQTPSRLCPRCQHPHLDASDKCHDTATVNQIRAIIDAVNHSAEAKSAASKNYLTLLDQWLYRRAMMNKKSAGQA